MLIGIWLIRWFKPASSSSKAIAESTKCCEEGGLTSVPSIATKQVSNLWAALCKPVSCVLCAGPWPSWTSSVMPVATSSSEAVAELEKPCEEEGLTSVLHTGLQSDPACFEWIVDSAWAAAWANILKLDAIGFHEPEELDVMALISILPSVGANRSNVPESLLSSLGKRVFR